MKLRLGSHVVLRSIIQILLGNSFLLGEGSIALDVELRAALIGFRDRHSGFSLRQLRVRLRQLPLGLRKLPACLIQCRLERTRVDLEEKLAFLHESALYVSLVDQIAGHLGLDVRIDQPIQRADPFLVNWYILLNDLYHSNFNWLRCGGFGCATGTTGGHDEQAGGKCRQRNVSNVSFHTSLLIGPLSSYR